eukprot:jgi/Orpsp1_1/1177189/evm.model.c7180000060512.1
MDQVNEICENYDVEDEGIAKNIHKNNHPNCKRLKKMFVFYCILVTFFLLFPFMTVFLYKPECKSLMTFMVNSTKRAFYISSVTLYSMELFVRDRYYYKEGQELAKMVENYNSLSQLESDLKSGKYGGKPSSGYSIYARINGDNPGCVRSKYQDVDKLCKARVYDEVYTEELANSSTDYLMVEFLNKVKEFIDNPPVRNYNLTDQNDLKKIVEEVETNPYMRIFAKLTDDITGHINYISEEGTEYLTSQTIKYRNITLIVHGVCSFLIYATFFVFVSRPIKKQLRSMDSMTNVTFSIPTSIYNSCSKVKNFIENGKLED